MNQIISKPINLWQNGWVDGNENGFMGESQGGGVSCNVPRKGALLLREALCGWVWQTGAPWGPVCDGPQHYNAEQGPVWFTCFAGFLLSAVTCDFVLWNSTVIWIFVGQKLSLGCRWRETLGVSSCSSSTDFSFLFHQSIFWDWETVLCWKILNIYLLNILGTLT